MLRYFTAGIFFDLDDFSSEDFYTLLLVLLFVVVVVFIILPIAIALNGTRKDRIPIETQFAFLIGKQPSTAAKTPAIFQLDDGRRFRFMVDTYSTMIVGDRGVLTWKGNQFLNFERI